MAETNPAAPNLSVPVPRLAEALDDGELYNGETVT
jgi:hypothetical protein